MNQSWGLLKQQTSCCNTICTSSVVDLIKYDRTKVRAICQAGNIWKLHINHVAASHSMQEASVTLKSRLTQYIRWSSDSVTHPMDLFDSLCCSGTHSHLKRRTWDFVINKTFNRTSQACQSKQEHLAPSVKLQNMQDVLPTRWSFSALGKLNRSWQKVMTRDIVTTCYTTTDGRCGVALAPSQNCWMLLPNLTSNGFSMINRSRMSLYMDIIYIFRRFASDKLERFPLFLDSCICQII